MNESIAIRLKTMKHFLLQQILLHAALLLLIEIRSCKSFITIVSNTKHHSSSTSIVSSSNDVQSRTRLFATTEKKLTQLNVNHDDNYPYQFTGRLWFSPSIVKCPESSPNPSVNFISLFGYTLGGLVALEYDTSPVGPYREYVTMSALVNKRGSIGQWGSRLYVSKQKAEDICREVWGVPAELANIQFCDDTVDTEISRSSSTSREEQHPCPLQTISYPDPMGLEGETQNIMIEGWKNTKILTQDEYDNNGKGAQRWGGFPVNWTPTIKALWSPFVPIPPQSEDGDDMALPLHKLRLSASAIRLIWTGFKRPTRDESIQMKDSIGFNLRIGLVVDNVLIEISKQNGYL